MLIPEKVVEVVQRFSPLEPDDEIPDEAEDAALFWINKSCARLKERIAYEIAHDQDPAGTSQESVPDLQPLEYLWDLADGCSIASLLSFYCPDDLSWHEICYNEQMSLADAIYNLQLVQYFCQEKLPTDIFFLSVEDLIECHRSMRTNVLCFIADLLFHFEIRPAACVRRPQLEHYHLLSSEDELLSNGHVAAAVGGGGRRRPEEMPTPAEMKAMSLQHQSWHVGHGEPPQRSMSTVKLRPQPVPARPAAHRLSGQHQRRSQVLHDIHGHEQEHHKDDEELMRYFSALDVESNSDAAPELLLGHGSDHGPMSTFDTTPDYSHASPLRAAGHTSTPVASTTSDNNVSTLSSRSTRRPERSPSRDSFTDSPARRLTTSGAGSLVDSPARKLTTSSPTHSPNMQKVLAQLNDSSRVKDCFEQDVDDDNRSMFAHSIASDVSRTPQKVNLELTHKKNPWSLHEQFEQLSQNMSNSGSAAGISNWPTAGDAIGDDDEPMDIQVAAQVHNVKHLMEEKVRNDCT